MIPPLEVGILVPNQISSLLKYKYIQYNLKKDKCLIQPFILIR